MNLLAVFFCLLCYGEGMGTASVSLGACQGKETEQEMEYVAQISVAVVRLSYQCRETFIIWLLRFTVCG